jgi:hypothetical protein
MFLIDWVGQERISSDLGRMLPVDFVRRVGRMKDDRDIPRRRVCAKAFADFKPA